MNRIIQAAVCAAAALMLLAACGGAPAATPAATPAAEPAPTPEAAPESPLAAPESPLAGPDAGEEVIPWTEALALLQSGQVEFAAQSHSLDVMLTLEDGTIIMTREPAIDDLFRAIEECGEPCADIALATE